jgi:flagellar hook assembly protein FlgD
VEAEVLDLSGRRVWGLPPRAAASGPGELEWDGRDDAGKRAPDGIYWIRVTAGTLTVTRRLTLLR